MQGATAVRPGESRPGRSVRSFEGLEQLEPRTLFATTLPVALAMTTTSNALGGVLNITGTAGDDRISVSLNAGGGIRVSNATGWSTVFTGSVATIRVDALAGNDRVQFDPALKTNAVIYGGAGVDSLVGGAGSDRIYGGTERDYLYGYGGNDVLVALGDSGVDRLYGGEGTDSFWLDSGADELTPDVTAAETAAGAVHRVGGYMALTTSSGTYQPSRGLGPRNLPDPTLSGYATGYQNFSKYPLFSKYGPRADDVFQGSIGDCYLLASLGSVANTNAQLLRERVVDLGDGTYAVQFTSGSTTTYVRVDGDLPTASWGLAYAKLGRQGSLWVAIIEKAYAFFRNNSGSYASLESGFMGDVYTHMGLANSSLFSTTSTASLMQRIQTDLAAGKAVTFGTKADVGALPVTGGHAYMVDSVVTNSAGTVTHLRLRNPWGTDDTAGHGADDGYILITAAQASAAFWFMCSATVR